jgi:hypothetical protein
MAANARPATLMRAVGIVENAKQVSHNHLLDLNTLV